MWLLRIFLHHTVCIDAALVVEERRRHGCNDRKRGDEDEDACELRTCQVQRSWNERMETSHHARVWCGRTPAPIANGNQRRIRRRAAIRPGRRCIGARQNLPVPSRSAPIDTEILHGKEHGQKHGVRSHLRGLDARLLGSRTPHPSQISLPAGLDAVRGCDRYRGHWMLGHCP